MAKYALWYFKPFGGNYAVFDTNTPTSELGNLGFDYIIALHTCGKDGQFGQMPMSGYTYEAGYNDGKKLAQWIEREVSPGLPYLVEIPVLVKDGKEQWKEFEDSHHTVKPAVRGLDYWKGWVDGVYMNTGRLERGFYWNLEYPWQVVKGVVSESAIRELSDKILGWGQQFIWIPNVNDTINRDNTDIKSLARYFTYVFVQPHYYQRWREYYTGTLNGSPSEYPYLDSETGVSALVEVLNWVRKNVPNGYLELEVDGSINQYPELLHKACDYVSAQRRSEVGGLWPKRAYYYGVDLNNAREVKRHCPDW
ncbi:hypothetical protein [Thermococcus sp. 21S7]|uniref:hypothetical protein n=1 Tax=Thermococcus sp. 21S7 TaxID=1638221 RepID=UPI0014387034|nr:hypothetical protein [Thermococcus sp. 21S7]NJE61732.1 hypothetical protein [Thermococcus sp. 21S7]